MRNLIPMFMVALTPSLLAAQQTSASASATTAVAASAPAAVAATGDAQADARIDAAIARVEAENVSSASLAHRVQLGRARGVTASRVAAAVEGRADALIDARDALRATAGAATEATIELGADAIESGAQTAAVARIGSAFQADDRPRALGVLAALAAEGRLGADVVATVRGALDGGNAGAQIDGTTAAAAADGGADVTAAARATTAVVGGATRAGASVTGAVVGATPR